MVLIVLGNCWCGRLSVRLNQTQRARMLRTRRSCTHRHQFLKLESSTRIAIGGGGNNKEKIAVGSRPKMIAVVRHELVAERIEASGDSVPAKICGGLPSIGLQSIAEKDSRQDENCLRARVARQQTGCESPTWSGPSSAWRPN